MQTIYVEVYAGLCNRMRAIASGYNLAQKYGAELKVLWKLNPALNCSFDRLFKPIKNVEIIESHTRISLHFAYKKFFAKGFRNCNVDNISDIENNLKGGKNIYIRTPHQFYELGGYEIFVPQDNAIRKCECTIHSVADNLIGIHIRRTDNRKSIENSPTILFEEYMQGSIAEDHSVQFFLATDSPEDQDTLTKKFGDRIICQKGKTFSRDSQQGIEDALVDLLCLSRCEKIIGSYWSSFSETAALWNGKKDLEILSIQ